MDRTLVICKPDAVERGLVGEIISRFERRDLLVVAMDMRTVDEATAALHYDEHKDKPFYPELISFITRGPVVVMVVEGPEDTWKVVRTMVGATNPRDAAPGTIRGDLGILFTENLIHGSDAAESAEREIAIWFPGLA
jgi:nucleoside-diphosphate kinase